MARLDWYGGVERCLDWQANSESIDTNGSNLEKIATATTHPSVAPRKRVRKLAPSSTRRGKRETLADEVEEARYSCVAPTSHDQKANAAPGTADAGPSQEQQWSHPDGSVTVSEAQVQVLLGCVALLLLFGMLPGSGWLLLLLRLGWALRSGAPLFASAARQRRRATEVSSCPTLLSPCR